MCPGKPEQTAPPSSPIESPTQRDAELIERLKRDDEGALDTLMHIYAQPLSTVAYALLGAADQVQEVVQDTFIALWDQRETLDPQGNLAGYLYRTARNHTIDVIRTEQRQLRLADRAMRYDIDAPRVAHNAAEQSAEEADVAARLRHALESVPPRPRQVFLLSWYGRLSYAEIAELLGVTVASVHKMMYRATQRLAEVYPGQISE